MSMKFLTGIFGGVLLAANVVCAAGPVYPFFLKNPLPTTPAMDLNIEHPFRCEDRDLGDVNISSVIPVKKSDFKLTQFSASNPLPRFEVNGFTFDDMPVDEAVQQLVDEAGITVYAEDGVYPEMSGKDVYGELSGVMDELTGMGGVFYRYDATGKNLYLSKYTKFELKVPKNRLVMFAVLDAIRGANIATAVPDWGKYTVMMTLNQSDKETVEKLMDTLVRDSKLLLLDVGVYQVGGTTNSVPWQKVIDQYGVGRVHASDAGLIGRALTMGHNKKSDGLIATLKQSYPVSKISQGISVVPHTWKMRFDVGRCSFTKEDVNSLSFLLSTNIKSSDTIETNITLDTLFGEIAGYTTVTGLDDEIVILGVPASIIRPEKTGELMVTLKVRLIRLMSEGK